MMKCFFRAFFSYTESKIGVKAKGKEFADFKAHFTADDRGFGYIKIMVNIGIIILTSIALYYISLLSGLGNIA